MIAVSSCQSVTVYGKGSLKNAYRRTEGFLIKVGLLGTAQRKWERIAGVWLFCTVGVMALLFLMGILDIVFLDRLLFPILRILRLFALGSFAAAIILITAASNDWIL